MAQVKGTLWFDTNIQDTALKTAQRIRQQLEQEFAKQIDVKVNVQGLNELGSNSGVVKSKIDELTSSMTSHKSVVGELTQLYEQLNKQVAQFANTSKIGMNAAQQTNRASRESVQIERERTSIYARLNSNMKASVGISGQLNDSMAGLYSVYKAKEILDNIIAIGGQLEQQRVSIAAILHDSAHADVLFGKIKSLALQSPFGVLDLDKYTKQLSAYGFQYNELFDMTKRLADISAGAGTDISRLALALGHVRSATYLTGITLRQFSMNNIPMLKMLSDYYSELEKRIVTTAEVQKRISSREVGYEAVIEVIKRMTDEGGQFYNMQAVMADTLAGKWKNLKDAIDLMYGEIGESFVGDKLKDMATLLTNLTKKWREIIPHIVSATIALGSWRGVQALTNAGITNGVTAINALTGAFKTLGTAIKSASPYFAVFLAADSIMSLWQEQQKHASRLADILDSVIDKSQEGLKNIQEMTSKFKVNASSMMSKDELRQAIETMTNTVRDYSPTAAEDLNRAFEQGQTLRIDGTLSEKRVITSLEEQYESLARTLETTEKSYKALGDMRLWVQEAFDTTKERVSIFGIEVVNPFDDDFNDSIKNYSAALDEVKKAENDFLGNRVKLVEQLKKAGFADAENMSNEQLLLTYKYVNQNREAYGAFYKDLEVKDYNALNGMNSLWEKLQQTTLSTFTTINQAGTKLYERLSNQYGKDTAKWPEEVRKAVVLALDQMTSKVAEYGNMATEEQRRIREQFLKPFGIELKAETEQAYNAISEFRSHLEDLVGANWVVKLKLQTVGSFAEEAESLNKTVKDMNSKMKSLNLSESEKKLALSGKMVGGKLLEFRDYYETREKALEGLRKDNLLIDEETKSKKSGGGSRGGAKKDSVLEQWRLRVDALKDFYAEWKALRKELGRTGAYEEIFKSGIMPDMFDANGKPKYNLDNYAEELGKMNDALVGNTDARKKAKQNLKKEQFKEVTDRARQAAEEAMAELQHTIEQTTRKWDLYKEIANKTGNKENAMQLVFGNTANLRNGIESAKDYWRSMLESVAKGISPDDLERMSETKGVDTFGKSWDTVKRYRDEYMKAFRASADEEEKIYLELLEASMTFADKMAKIESQRKRDISAAGGDKNLIYAANQRAKESMSELDFQNLKEKINWDVVFGNLDTYTKDVLIKVRKQLKDYLRLNRTNMSVKDIKEMGTAINNINNAIQKEAGLFGGLRDAQNELTDATKDLLSAQVDYNAAIELYGEKSKQAEDAMKRVNEAQNRVVTAQGGVKKAETDTVSSITAIMNAFTSLGKSSEISLAEVGSAIGAIVSALSSSGSTYGQLIAAIFTLMDAIGSQGLDRFVGNILSGVGSAVGGIVKGVGNIFGSLFGDSHAFDFLTDFWDGNWRYEKAKQEYEGLVSTWEKLTDAKTRYFEEGWGNEARNAAKEAKELLDAQIEATRVIAQQRLDAGATAGSHSYGYRMWQGSYDYNKQNWKDVAEEAAKGMKAAGLGDVVFNSMEDMTRMTADQLEYLMKNYTGLWANMDGDFKEYLEKLIEYSRNAEEQIEKIKEKLTGWNFKSLSDSWANALSNMSNSATNLFEDFENGLREAIVNAMVSNIYSGEMKSLVNGLADAAQNELYTDVAGNVKKHTYDTEGNILDTDVLSEYTQEEYNNMRAVAENLAEREAASRDLLADLYGWEDDGATSSASQVLSGLSESDQGLFMSYVNAIRADASISRTLLERITVEVETMPTVWQNIADQTTLLRNIEANTSRNAESTGAIERLLTRMENGEFSVRVK